VFNNISIFNGHKDLTEQTLESFVIFPEEPFTSYMSYARNGQGRPQANWTDQAQSSTALTLAWRSWRIRAIVIFKTTIISQDKHNILALLSIQTEKGEIFKFWDLERFRWI